MSTPRLVIGGTQSGVGKTSLALGLARALHRRGLAVQTFKVGPDFLDPTWLAIASRRPCYNLDGWMQGPAYAQKLFQERAEGAEVALVEGVMGLFDGAGPADGAGSTAEMARLLQAPVALVVNAHGAGRSLAATVSGFASFEEGLGVAFVVANQVGSSSHGKLLAEALSARGLPPLVGAIPRGALPSLPSRHLGLVTAAGDQEAVLDALAQSVEQHLEVDVLLRGAGATQACSVAPNSVEANALARWGSPADGGSTAPGAHSAEVNSASGPGIPPAQGPPAQAPRVRIGLARDAAFHFYYADDLQAVQREGAELVPFSPLADAALPEDLDALWLGGGYPESHAQELSANQPMRDAVRRFADTGRPVYAECGGLMYLAQGLCTRDGQRFPMVGLLPGRTEMHERRRALGYVEVTLEQDSLWGQRGDRLRGHEFHYSDWVPEPAAGNWDPAYSLCRKRTGESSPAGLQRGRVVASYVHAHYASRPEAVKRFLEVSRKA